MNQKTKAVSLQICQLVEGIAMQKGHQFLARLLTIGLRLDLHSCSKDGKNMQIYFMRNRWTLLFMPQQESPHMDTGYDPRV